MKKYALVSVSDKSGVVEFCKELVGLGYDIISTGGTAAALSKAGVNNISISDITGFPECLDGRVKTLHPFVHAGLLARRKEQSHMQQLKELNINTIDVVAVNLYPFKATIQKAGVTLADAIENIDIGGPTMLRSAAKNFEDVLVLVDPSDYQSSIEHLKNKTDTYDYRLNLMRKVFAHTAAYDSMISTYMARVMDIEFPESITLAYEKAQDLRYGENPHQNGAFYRECFDYEGALTQAKQLQGKELSYNNINDTNAALDLLREFSEPCAVALKHANPCGVAIADNIEQAYLKAYESDPVSIFGGIVALNGEVTGSLASELIKTFLEIVIAPKFTIEALEVFKQKPNLRVLELASINAPLKKGTHDMKKVVGGLLVQDIDSSLYNKEDLRTVTKATPSKQQMSDLEFAYKVVKHCKSNAIAIAKDGQVLGLGNGQTNRIWAASEAIERSGEKVKGAVLASDAFFPFDDCVTAAAKAGITAIIQPGGSVRDNDSIVACDKSNIAMVFCGQRHFKH